MMRAQATQTFSIYSMLLPRMSDTCLSIGSLKYMHHFGLGPFSNPGEHWILQASLPHSISDERFVLPFASVLDASTLDSADSRRTAFAEGKIGSLGAATLIGFSRSKLSPHAHPARESARSRVNNHFIFAPPSCRLRHAFCRIMLSKQSVKEMDLRGRLLIC